MKKLILLSTLTVASFSSFAADYGVELAWNTNDSEQVLKTLPEPDRRSMCGAAAFRNAG